MSDAQPITGLRPGQVAPHIFLCGDPARVERISAHFEKAETVADVREYRVVTGEISGLPCSVASTGIGAPSTAILMEELVRLGGDTFLRLGNSGALHPELDFGDLVVSTGAVRDDGTSRAYVIPEYPAVADHVLVGALLAAAEERGLACRAGITWSIDAFFMRNAQLDGEHGVKSLSAARTWPQENRTRLFELRDAGVLNVEMEAGVMLTLAGLLGVRAGALCVISDKTPWAGPAAIDLDRNMETCIEVGVAAMLSAAKTPRAGA